MKNKQTYSHSLAYKSKNEIVFLFVKRKKENNNNKKKKKTRKTNVAKDRLTASQPRYTHGLIPQDIHIEQCIYKLYFPYIV